RYDHRADARRLRSARGNRTTPEETLLTVDGGKMKARIWESMKSFGSILVFVWVFTHGIAQATVVPSESMSPTILVGDHFFLDKLAFPANYPQAIQKYLPARTIHRGEIVAVWSPENPDIRLVKRVIGLSG